MEQSEAARREFCGNGEKCRNDNGKDVLGSGAGRAGSIGRRKGNACRRSVRAAEVEDSRETAAAGSRKENAGRGKATRMGKSRATA